MQHMKKDNIKTGNRCIGLMKKNDF
jgi:hypothetical protein